VAPRADYNVFNVSKEDLARIQELLGTTFREIRALSPPDPPITDTA
jgi:hypothetical protein